MVDKLCGLGPLPELDKKNPSLIVLNDVLLYGLDCCDLVIFCSLSPEPLNYR